jgi:hypothetical protein
VINDQRRHYQLVGKAGVSYIIDNTEIEVISVASAKTGRSVGRPSAMTPEVEERIIRRLVDGETLPVICDSADIPDYYTVFRHMTRNPNFANQVRQAREGLAEHLFNKIMVATDQIDEDNAGSMSAKIRSWQWMATKSAPRIYSERVAAAELAAAAGSPQTNVQINNIDMKAMSTEELLEFRRLLAKTKVAKPDEKAG